MPFVHATTVPSPERTVNNLNNTMTIATPFYYDFFDCYRYNDYSCYSCYLIDLATAIPTTTVSFSISIL